MPLRRGPASAALVYAAVTALLFRHLLPDLPTHLYAYLGDPLLNASILAWNATHVPLTAEWWNFPGFAPLSGVTAFTEHLLLAYPIASPIFWTTGNAILAYNVVYLLAFPLNGMSAYALARELTGSARAAFIGGLAFAFAPYRGVQMTHVQMLMAFGIPLTLLGLHRYISPPALPAKADAGPDDRPTRVRGLALFAFGWLCAALANAYNIVFVPLLVVAWCAWFVRPAQWRRLVAPGMLAVLVVVLMAPLLWGYHVRQSMYGLSRQYDEVKSFAADFVGVGRIFHRSTFWRGIIPETFEEGAIFPGLTIVGLSLYALIRREANRAHSSANAHRPRDTRFSSRRLLAAAATVAAIVLLRVWTGSFGWHFGPIPLPPFQPYRLFTVAFVLLIAGVIRTRSFRRAWRERDPVMFYAVGAFVMWMVALGPEPAWSGPWRGLWFGPYRLLMEIPGVDSIRVPARAWLAAVLCLAMLAGMGAAAVFQRWPRYRLAATVALAVLIAAEGWFFDVTARAPRPMRAGMIPRGALVLDMPVEEVWWNAVPQYRAVIGGYRTINGYSGYEPPHFNPLRHAIAERQPDALTPYRQREDLYVIIRPGENPDVVRWITAGAPHLYEADDARVYRLPRIRPNPELSN